MVLETGGAKGRGEGVEGEGVESAMRVEDKRVEVSLSNV
jgi:hypothetical protein